MKRVLKNMTSNWFVFFGYLSLFLLTIIAALQIYDANYKLTDRYKELAHTSNLKLTLLLRSRENLEALHSITVDKVFHPNAVTAEKESRFAELWAENDANLDRYQKFNVTGAEKIAVNQFRESWQKNKQTTSIFVGLQKNEDSALAYFRSVQQKSYQDLQNAVSFLSLTLSNEVNTEEAAADRYFKKSIAFINILIGIRIAILLMVGIIIFNVVAKLRSKNRMLQQTQTKLLQNQSHLLASQEISKTGSWELNLSGPDLVHNELFWSEETYRIFGYEPGAVLATNELFFSHVPDADKDRITQAIQESLQTGVPYEIEHFIVLQNGETKVICERSDIFYDKNGKPDKMIGTCQDITDRKMAEEKLAESEGEKHRLKDQINKQRIYRQKEITRATIKAQEKERLELGRELHDNVNQILSTSKLFIENSFHNPERQEEMLNRSKELINTSIEELRRLSRLLAPPSLGDLTLKESIEEIADEYNLVDGKKIVEHKIIDLDENTLSDDLKISIYRIIQEQLHNIRKYAGASKVQVYLKHGPHNIILHIEDNGCGFDVSAKRKGLGITNIINRAETFNGSVQIITSPGKGCSIYINFRLIKASVVQFHVPETEPAEKHYGTGS